MRKLSLLCFALTACPGLGQVGFDVSSQGTSTIQGSPLGGILPPSFNAFNGMTFNQSQTFKNENTDKDHIASAKVSALLLKVTSPSGGTLDFLQTIEFDISAPNLPTVAIAQATSVPAGATQLSLTVPDQEIAAYAKSDSFSVTTKATGTQPSQSTTIEADLTIHIVANVL